MSRLAIVSFLLVALTTHAGCAASMAVTAREQEAFVVRAGFLKTFVYRCSAENPEQPICIRVTEN